MRSRGFWDELKAPIIGLAPMDGVTDAPFRYMVAKHSKPSVILTEFTNVEGLAHGATKMLSAFWYDEIERPVVGQIYGMDVKAFYQATLLLAFLGFDGVDINMGCPANKVAKQGAGAGLIRTPELAKTIVRTCQKASQDWANGITLEEAGLPPDIIAEASRMRAVQLAKQPKDRSWDDMPRNMVPISVKTRIGYDRPVVEAWISHLLEVEPATISLHGRTLKQMYTGKADWDEIAKAAHLTRGTPTTLLGNGDIESMEDALSKIQTYHVDGVLVGRAVLGHPAFFNGTPFDPREALQMAIKHSEYREQHFPELGFEPIRKHLLWYCRAFPHAKELRLKLCRARNASDVKESILAFEACI